MTALARRRERSATRPRQRRRSSTTPTRRARAARPTCSHRSTSSRRRWTASASSCSASTTSGVVRIAATTARRPAGRHRAADPAVRRHGRRLDALRARRRVRPHPRRPASAPCCARTATLEVPARRRRSAAPARPARPRGGCSGWSTRPPAGRRPGRRAPRRTSTRSTRTARSTRSPASCCPTTSTRRSRCSTAPGNPLGELEPRRRHRRGHLGARARAGRVPPDAGPAGRPARARRSTPRPDRRRAGPRRRRRPGTSAEPASRSARCRALLRADRHDAVDASTRSPASASPTIAGLVGRPIAVVRATLRLDAPDDLDEVDVTDAGGADGAAAFAALAAQRFPVRIGELTRSDDARARLLRRRRLRALPRRRQGGRGARARQPAGTAATSACSGAVDRPGADAARPPLPRRSRTPVLRASGPDDRG